MQGRFKRDGSAAAEPERGGSDRGSSAQHAQNPASVQSGDSGPGAARTGAPGGSLPADETKAKGSKTPPGPGPRIALRNWRISTRLVSLLALPVITATSLGALRINSSMDEIQQLDNMKLLTDLTEDATRLAVALQEERDQSAGPLSHGASDTDFTVKSVREKTDRAYKNFLAGTQNVDDSDGDKGFLGIRQNTVQITRQLQKIKDVRRDAYQKDVPSSQTVDGYSQLIQQLLALSEDMAQATSNPDMIQRTRALAAFSSAKEFASVQRAVIAAALPPNNREFGKLSDLDRRYALTAFEKEADELQSFNRIYVGNGAKLLAPISRGNQTIQGADAYAQRVLEQPNGIKLRGKRSYKDWVDADSSKISEMGKIELTLLDEMEQKARSLRNESEQQAILNGALILLVLGVSLVGAFVVARSMIRSLRRLQDTATKVAQDRLPELVKQLSESDPQDVDTSVESVGVHSRDEIGQVAAAFDDVHREAVRLAAEQALLRGNVNAMFTNLSRRSQGLIQRQLSLISELESREADPDQLSSLFKLDHLATRMRRNGENLLVLAGEEPGRRWTRPVPLVDVLRAAASEVEQYERIELSSVPATDVAGRVVNDLVHLLAELLENATSFSSPQTKVKVTGHALPDGRVLIEIHDTGIGLSPEDLAAINERLASPPTVDVSVSRRMGLFVVGRLSQRHGIRIQLRPSDSGGTTALVMLPVDVAQGGKKGPGQPGAPAPTGGPAAAQAAAGAAAARRGGGVAAGLSGAARARQNNQVGPAAGAQRGQVAGSGPRAALPSRGNGQGPAAGAPSAPSPVAPAGLSGPGAPGAGAQGGRGGAGAFGQGQGGGRAGAGSMPQPPVPQQRTNDAGQAVGSGAGAGSGSGSGERDRRPQLPPRGGPRAELPGGSPQQPRVPSWSDENAQPQVSREPFDAPRGHEEPESTGQFPHPGANADDLQGPGSTSQFERPDFDGPPPGTQGDATGEFVRSDVFGGPSPAAPQAPQNPQPGQSPHATGEFSVPRPPAPRRGQAPRADLDQGGQQQPQRPQAQLPQAPQPQPQQSEPEALPPASGPLDGRTPLYDTLETNWFSQQAQQQAEQQERAQQERAQQERAEQERQAQARAEQERQQAERNRQAEQADAHRPELPQRGTHGQAGAPQAPQQPQRGHGLPRREPQLPQREPQRPLGGTRPQGARPPQPSPATPPPSPRPGGLQAPGPHGQPGQGVPQNQQHPQNQQNLQNPQNPNSTTGNTAWRATPNDELGRQAERVRQPSAGGVTTSGLPRRVPRANLVAGTAQQAQDSSGPQVSRAPEEVRGRLTNLRRGIQQGRQAGTGQTGSFPTHQQER
ncbi:sensor histidine kinase [Streptomyces spectabilis]|uniref:histidine kinase n=1 Tax=Streptomyces spectabilis TaxID=68270 RepID=A0A5P2XBL4_STRST|nr:nitrate- and nitrite sensing domain-containing protein [Streptomyces spectabilis]MBB5104262.1 signal transduction histidine kinase [Streptomyces spectabilis]MCI3905378.1 nitrate- and nitrite sensing domain-containing protein [Streptomyces spectabilis]QEV62373.1 HAMP domain-containing protein [Streptomyces spectabilis]GGU98864.1 histidine kinase [Streptomyces spectabilis]